MTILGCPFITAKSKLKIFPFSFFFRHNLESRYSIFCKNIVSNLIDDQKISFSKAYIELMDIDARHLSFENKKSHDDFLNKMKGGQSSFCPTNGAFKFQVLKTMLSAKNFHKVTQHFNFEKKDESFRTLDQREIFYTILLDNIDLKEYSLYIISHGKINRTHFKISFLGHWKILL